jgi:hypothetical protein
MNKPAEEFLDGVARIRIGMTEVPGERKEWLPVVFAERFQGKTSFI